MVGAGAVAGAVLVKVKTYLGENQLHDSTVMVLYFYGS
jgi:hypothetical protein